MIKLRKRSRKSEVRCWMSRLLLTAFFHIQTSYFRPRISDFIMKTKEEIVKNWLPRYTGEKLDNFGKYLLLTNFSNYVSMFAKWNNVEIVGEGKPMQCATADNITIINFGMGSPTAATVMDLLTAISPKAVLFLGK